MKTVNKYILSLAVGAFAAVGMSSCSDFLQEYSQDLAKVESWQDLDEVLLGSGYMQPSAMSAQGRNGDDIDCLITDTSCFRPETHSAVMESRPPYAQCHHHR